MCVRSVVSVYMCTFMCINLKVFVWMYTYLCFLNIHLCSCECVFCIISVYSYICICEVFFCVSTCVYMCNLPMNSKQKRIYLFYTYGNITPSFSFSKTLNTLRDFWYFKKFSSNRIGIYLITSKVIFWSLTFYILLIVKMFTIWWMFSDFKIILMMGFNLKFV